MTVRKDENNFENFNLRKVVEVKDGKAFLNENYKALVLDGMHRYEALNALSRSNKPSQWLKDYIRVCYTYKSNFVSMTGKDILQLGSWRNETANQFMEDICFVDFIYQTVSFVLEYIESEDRTISNVSIEDLADDMMRRNYIPKVKKKNTFK